MRDIRIHINGCGRIGRTLIRVILESYKNISIVSVHDKYMSIDSLVYLLKNDSLFGRLAGELDYFKDKLKYKERVIKFENETINKNKILKDKIDFIIECSGSKALNKLEQYKNYLKGLIVSSYNSKSDKMIIMGINEDTYKITDKIVSNGSCTSHCISHIIKIINSKFDISNIALSIIHSYTNSQNLVDNYQKGSEIRKSRSANLSIIPSKTEAQYIIQKIFPNLENKMTSLAYRVPSYGVSTANLIFNINNVSITANEINRIIKNSNSVINNYIEYNTEELVSSDFKFNATPCIFDALLTQTSNSSHSSSINITAWYNNELAYSNQICSLIQYINSK